MNRILVIENDSVLGRLIGFYLLDQGFEVSKVSMPEEVAERLEATSPDLVIFNTGLPPEEKSNFIASWRTLAPAMRILEVSESALITRPNEVDMAAVGRPDLFMGIPFDLDKLGELVKESLEEQP